MVRPLSSRVMMRLPVGAGVALPLGLPGVGVVVVVDDAVSVGVIVGELVGVVVPVAVPVTVGVGEGVTVSDGVGDGEDVGGGGVAAWRSHPVRIRAPMIATENRNRDGIGKKRIAAFLDFLGLDLLEMDCCINVTERQRFRLYFMTRMTAFLGWSLHEEKNVWQLR